MNRQETYFRYLGRYTIEGFVWDNALVLGRGLVDARFLDLDSFDDIMGDVNTALREDANAVVSDFHDGCMVVTENGKPKWEITVKEVQP